MNNTVFLVSSKGERIKLKLNTECAPFKVENILNAYIKVCEDVKYDLEIEDCSNNTNVEVYLNGEKMNAFRQENKLSFFADNNYLFSGIIGFAQLSICFTFDDGVVEWKYSDYLKVLIKATETNKVIDEVFKYVYENQAEFLTLMGQATTVGKDNRKQYGDFWSQIILLEEIAGVYEENYGYFKANSRFKLEREYVLDRVEKLQFVDGKTIQYMTQHPEYLKQEVTGIKHGRQSFLPTKALMQRNLITYDIYENQVVKNFLDVILGKISDLQKKIEEYKKMIDLDERAENGYIVSTNILYINAKDILEGFSEKTKELKAKFEKLAQLYSQVFDVKDGGMEGFPEPTAIFLNVPQYNRVYDCIVKWYGKKGYDLIREQVMLSFSNAPEIYEAYVLLKFINQIKECGYQMIEAKSISYPRQNRYRSREKAFHNVYVFEHEESTLTLYYEPVIYDTSLGSRSGINLYRNNSVSLARETECERKGHYYVPDYIIKIVEGDQERYIICDAKFSRKGTVKYQLVPGLAYKYLTSISPSVDNAEIRGLYVLYALDEGNQNSESFYDRQLTDGKKISPNIEMVPLSENVLYSNQDSNAREMLKTILAR